MDSDQQKSFDQRLNQWIADQGFWFQLRHAFGSGTTGRSMFQLVRMFMRLLVLVLAAVVIGGVWLERRTRSQGFHRNLESRAAEALGAKELKIGGIQQSNGILEIGRCTAEGRRDTIFTSFEAGNIRLKMNLIEDVLTKWRPGRVMISRMSMDIRGGASDDASAQSIGDKIFREFDQFQIDTIEIADMSLCWGHSPGTRGSIENGRMILHRGVGSLWITVEGGIFRQNWLEDLEIRKLTVVCTREGIRIEEGLLTRDQATVDLSGVSVKTGAVPEIDGVVKVRNYPMKTSFPTDVSELMEAVISGDFEVSGSTNHSAGVRFSGKVTMGPGASVTLRETIPLLRALTVVDGLRNYRRVPFESGNFVLKTGGGMVEISDLQLKSGDLLWLSGELKARRPTQQETEALDPRKPVSDAGAQKMEVEPEFSFADFRAENTGVTDVSGDSGSEKNFFDRIARQQEENRKMVEISDAALRMLRYEGRMVASLQPDVFDRSPELRGLFPTDAATKRLNLEVPLQGALFELTKKQSEELYRRGKR